VLFEADHQEQEFQSMDTFNNSVVKSILNILDKGYDRGCQEAFRIGDGYCDDVYNTVECQNDGGD